MQMGLPVALCVDYIAGVEKGFFLVVEYEGSATIRFEMSQVAQKVTDISGLATTKLVPLVSDYPGLVVMFRSSCCQAECPSKSEVGDKLRRAAYSNLV